MTVEIKIMVLKISLITSKATAVNRIVKTADGNCKHV